MLSTHCPGRDPLVLPTYVDIEELRTATHVQGRRTDRDRGRHQGRRGTETPSPPSINEPKEA